MGPRWGCGGRSPPPLLCPVQPAALPLTQPPLPGACTGPLPTCQAVRNLASIPPPVSSAYMCPPALEGCQLLCQSLPFLPHPPCDLRQAPTVLATRSSEYDYEWIRASDSVSRPQRVNFSNCSSCHDRLYDKDAFLQANARVQNFVLTCMCSLDVYSDVSAPAPGRGGGGLSRTCCTTDLSPVREVPSGLRALQALPHLSLWSSQGSSPAPLS